MLGLKVFPATPLRNHGRVRLRLHKNFLLLSLSPPKLDPRHFLSAPQIVAGHVHPANVETASNGLRRLDPQKAFLEERFVLVALLGAPIRQREHGIGRVIRGGHNIGSSSLEATSGIRHLLAARGQSRQLGLIQV